MRPRGDCSWLRFCVSGCDVCGGGGQCGCVAMCVRRERVCGGISMCVCVCIYGYMYVLTYVRGSACFSPHNTAVTTSFPPPSPTVPAPPPLLIALISTCFASLDGRGGDVYALHGMFCGRLDVCLAASVGERAMGVKRVGVKMCVVLHAFLLLCVLVCVCILTHADVSMCVCVCTRARART